MNSTGPLPPPEPQHDEMWEDTETEGAQARASGAAVESNPYPDGSELWVAWVAGWMQQHRRMVRDDFFDHSPAGVREVPGYGPYQLNRRGLQVFDLLDVEVREALWVDIVGTVGDEHPVRLLDLVEAAHAADDDVGGDRFHEAVREAAQSAGAVLPPGYRFAQWNRP